MATLDQADLNNIAAAVLATLTAGTAELSLKSFLVTNTAGDAVVFTSSAEGGSGLRSIGSNTYPGAGIRASGYAGVSGEGVASGITGYAADGAGIDAIAYDGAGFKARSSHDGHGVSFAAAGAGKVDVDADIVLTSAYDAAKTAGTSTFNPATDEVDVGAVKGTPVTSVDDFKADVSGLAATGEAATAAGAVTVAGYDTGQSPADLVTGFSTHSAADVVTELGTGSTLTALATAASITALTEAGVKKNVALGDFPIMLYDASDHTTPKTGLTVTATRSLDGAAFAACANGVVEVGNGWYKIDLADTDLNGDTVALKFTATGADPVGITIKTSA